MIVSEKFLTACFNRDNPPTLDRAKRSNILSLKAIHTLSDENSTYFQGARGQVALGLLFLWHDHWEESHQIAQSDEGEADHDLLHAIVHRRENDFANSAYWFREAGKNKAFGLLSVRTAKLLLESGLKSSILPDGQWNSGGFLAAVKKKNPESLLRALQAEEIIAFFETLIT